MKFSISIMMLCGLSGALCATEPQSAAPVTATAQPMAEVRLKRAAMEQHDDLFSMVADLELVTLAEGVTALPDRIVELTVKDDAGHELKADWQIDNAGMDLLWPSLEASIWVSTPIVGKWVEFSGKVITLVSEGADIRRMVVNGVQATTVALEGHMVTCTPKTADDGTTELELVIVGEHIAYITGIRFLTPEGESMRATAEDCSPGFVGMNAAAIHDVYRYRLAEAPQSFVIELTVQKPVRVEAVPFRFRVLTDEEK